MLQMIQYQKTEQTLLVSPIKISIALSNLSGMEKLNVTIFTCQRVSAFLDVLFFLKHKYSCC